MPSGPGLGPLSHSVVLLEAGLPGFRSALAALSLGERDAGIYVLELTREGVVVGDRWSDGCLAVDVTLEHAHRVQEEAPIGDATRTLGDQFGLYPNHARILQHLRKCGFTALPDILWRKPTNAPNKFMGSGVLPVGAYVTLEHEYILIARKGARRVFSSEREKKKRRESALFWEERNVWYSDVWTDLTGTGQGLSPGTARSRSAAYPFELAYRLINMFSLRNDTVLDPFLGTGTTLLASMASQRHSVGFELDNSLRATIEKGCASIVDQANDYIRARLERHAQFVADREVKHRNRRYGFGVVSAQEREIRLNALSAVSAVGDDEYEVRYAARKRCVRA